MKWGFFGPVHIATLVLVVLMNVGLYFALKKASQKVQTWVLGILSFSGIAAVIYNLVSWGSPWEYLPLHLCSLTAMVLPVAVFTRNKTCGNLLLLWSLGALAAIVVNNAQADFEVFSPIFGFYFFPHALEFGIPILMFKLGLVKKDVKCVGSTMLITVVVYTLVHLANLWINGMDIVDANGADVVVNYMYSLVPENPVMQLCYNILPVSYWYMYLIFPIVGVYLLGVYAPQILQIMKKKKEKTTD